MPTPPTPRLLPRTPLLQRCARVSAWLVGYGVARHSRRRCFLEPCTLVGRHNGSIIAFCLHVTSNSQVQGQQYRTLAAGPATTAPPPFRVLWLFLRTPYITSLSFLLSFSLAHFDQSLSKATLWNQRVRGLYYSSILCYCTAHTKCTLPCLGTLILYLRANPR